MDAHDVPPQFVQRSVPIRAQQSGYVQLIGDDLLRVWPPEHVNDKVCKQGRETFTLGKQRTPTQDVEFALLELVEVGLRALPPSTNDPYTVVNTLDQFSVALCVLAERPFPATTSVETCAKLGGCVFALRRVP